MWDRGWCIRQQIFGTKGNVRWSRSADMPITIVIMRMTAIMLYMTKAITRLSRSDDNPIIIHRMRLTLSKANPDSHH